MTKNQILTVFLTLSITLNTGRRYFPSTGTDSWICSGLFSILSVWLWLGLGLVSVKMVKVKVRIRVMVSVNKVELGWGRKIAPVADGE